MLPDEMVVQVVFVIDYLRRDFQDILVARIFSFKPIQRQHMISRNGVRNFSIKFGIDYWI